MQRCLQPGAVVDDPSINRSVVKLDPSCFHAFFDMTRAEGYARDQRTPMRMISLGQCAPLKLLVIVVLSHITPLLIAEVAAVLRR